MGQAVTTTDGAGRQSSALVFPDNIQRHAYEIKQLASLSYDSFLASITELNDIASGFSDINGKTLVFQVKKGTDRTWLWRGTVRIKCHKVDGLTGVIESSRQMNMKQYVHLYNEIKQQAAITSLGTLSTQHDLSASLILNRFGGELEGEVWAAEGDECCICMDRKSEVILKCSHSYCEKCIDQWHGNSRTCPICRAKVRIKDESWVLADRPDVGEMAFETTEYLFGLTARSGVETQLNQSQARVIRANRNSAMPGTSRCGSNLGDNTGRLSVSDHEPNTVSEQTTSDFRTEVQRRIDDYDGESSEEDMENEMGDSQEPDTEIQGAETELEMDENSRELAAALRHRLEIQNGGQSAENYYEQGTTVDAFTDRNASAESRHMQNSCELHSRIPSGPEGHGDDQEGHEEVDISPGHERSHAPLRRTDDVNQNSASAVIRENESESETRGNSNRRPDAIPSSQSWEEIRPEFELQ